MKVLLTSKRNIVSKDKKKYVIYNGISGSGNNVELFLNEDEAQKYNIPDANVLAGADVQDIFNDFSEALVNVEYNDKGRIENVTL